jgi:hypothetical protein
LLEASIDELGPELLDRREDRAVARNRDVQFVCNVRRNVICNRFGVAIVGFPHEGLHLDEIDHALEVVFRADRQLYGQRTRTETLLDHVHAAQESSTAAIHLVDVADARHAVVVGEAPIRFRLRLHTGDAVEHDDSAVEHAQRAIHFDREVHVPWGVDDVDFLLAPERRHGGRLNRDAALLFLLHVVGRRRGLQVLRLVDVDDGVLAPRVIKDALGSGGLSGIDVGNDADIADVRKGGRAGHNKLPITVAGKSNVSHQNGPPGAWGAAGE